VRWEVRQQARAQAKVERRRDSLAAELGLAAAAMKALAAAA